MYIVNIQCQPALVVSECRCRCCRPEYVGMSEAVHQLYLLQHVGSVTGHGVHLQSHHLPGDTMLNLQRKKARGNTCVTVTDRL